LARAFSLAETPGPIRLWSNADLTLGIVGVGAGKLEQVNQAVPACDAVILAGLAGALSPALKIGDVVVDAHHSNTPLPPLDRAFIGRILTSPAIASTPQQKARLFQSSGCLAVEMEGDRVAKFAAARGAPFVSVRGISDTAREPLDPALLTLVDGEGKPRIGRAVRMLCLHPQKLRTMLRLAGATRRAMDEVSVVLRNFVASGWPNVASLRQQKSDDLSRG